MVADAGRSIFNIKEDRYNPGSFFLMSRFTIRKFTPGQPITPFLGNPSQTLRKHTDGNSTVAEFSQFIFDLVQYNRTKMAIADYFNHCLREYDYETDAVSSIAGDCNDSLMPIGKLRLSDRWPARSNFMNGIFAVVLVESENYFIVCDHAYGQMVKYDVATQTVELLVATHYLYSPMSLLLNTQGTEVYVGHPYGLSKVNLATRKVSLLSGNNTQIDPSVYIAQKFGPFTADSVGSVQCLSWLVPDQVLVAIAEANEVLVVANMAERNILASCHGKNSWFVVRINRAVGCHKQL